MVRRGRAQKGLGWKGAWPKGGGVVWCEGDGLRRGWVGKGRGLREGAWFGAKGMGLEGVVLERGVAYGRGRGFLRRGRA